YASRQRPTTAYPALTTTSTTFSSAGMRCASAELVKPIRGRSSNTSTLPSFSPRTYASPTVGCIIAPPICSSVVLPAPLGPMMTQRSSSSTVQSTLSSSTLSPRRTVTPTNCSTASAFTSATAHIKPYEPQAVAQGNRLQSRHHESRHRCLAGTTLPTWGKLGRHGHQLRRLVLKCDRRLRVPVRRRGSRGSSPPDRHDVSHLARLPAGRASRAALRTARGRSLRSGAGSAAQLHEAACRPVRKGDRR